MFLYFYFKISCGNKKNQSVLKLSDLPKNFLRPQKFRTLITFTTSEIITLDQRSQDCLREITVRLLKSFFVENVVKCDASSSNNFDYESGH